MKPHFIFLALLAVANAGFYDSACPGKRLSIGACLAGLCPAGSECIGSFCCKTKKVESGNKTGEEEIEEEGSPEFGTCLSGYHAIGECISDTCPDGYICEDMKCCSKITRDRNETEIINNIRVFTLRPVKISEATKLLTTEPPTTESSGSEEELLTNNVTQPDESDENEIEQLKKEYQKLKELLEKKMKSKWITTTRATTEETTVPSTTTEEEVRKEESSEEAVEPTEKEEKEKSEELEDTTEAPTSTTRLVLRKLSPTTTSTSTTTTTTPTTTTEEEETTTEDEKLLCPVGGPIGECISNQCPEGHTCYNNYCCILTPELNCTDSLNNCKQELCDRRGYKDFMTRQCAKTCARCHFILGEKIECRDRRTDCAEWAAEGFCQSTLYTTRQKMKFCGKSCKLC